MDMLFWLLGLALAIFLFKRWANEPSVASLRNELDELRLDLKDLREKTGFPRTVPEKRSTGDENIPYVPRPVTMPSRREEDFIFHQDRNITPPGLVPRATEEEEISLENPSSYTPQKSATNSIEFNFGAKLPVWIGAISLIFAGFFLVKYSFESGLLGPTTRVTLGLLFGLAMTVAGKLIIRRPQIANHERIAQGLCGAGLVSLYVCLYGAVNLYGLISPTIGFIGMSIVTAMAVILSLRIGQPIAVFGLIGGLLTPALVGSEEANSAVLFIYLFVLFAGLSFVMVRRGWWMLSALTLLGVFSWTTIWLLSGFRAEESFQMILLQMGVLFMILSMTRKFIKGAEAGKKDADQAHMLNGTAIAGTAATIMVVSTKMTLGFFDWSMLGLLGLAVVTLAYFRPAPYKYGVWGMLVVKFVLYLFWFKEASQTELQLVLAGLIIIYVFLPQLLLRKVSDPRFWAGVQIAAMGIIYGLSNYSLSMDDKWWAGIALLLAAVCTSQVRTFRLQYKADSEIENRLVGMYAFAASTFLSVGFIKLLPPEYLPAAFAIQAMGSLWLYGYTRIAVLDVVAMILSVFFAALQFKQIYLFLSLGLASLVDENIPSYMNRYLLDVPLIYLGVPAFALLCGVFLRMRNEIRKPLFLHAVFVIGLMAVMAMGYYSIRMAFQTGDLSFALRAGFIERGFISFLFAAVGLVVCFFVRQDFKKWGVVLFSIFMARLAWFDLVLHNPYLDSSQKVGEYPLFNGITMTYLGGAAVLFWAARKNISGLGQGIAKIFSIILLPLIMVFLSLTVRHAYHGEFLSRQSDTPSMELYTYSIVWLVSALLFLAVGLARDNKPIRLASLLVMTLTILKVFLIDAAHLEGLYRVFSFLGLGLSLIGLSYFYTKFVARSSKA